MQRRIRKPFFRLVLPVLLSVGWLTPLVHQVEVAHTVLQHYLAEHDPAHHPAHRPHVEETCDNPRHHHDCTLCRDLSSRIIMTVYLTVGCAPQVAFLGNLGSPAPVLAPKWTIKGRAPPHSPALLFYT